MAEAWTSIDFETANDSAASACAVGLVKVRDGVAVAERAWLVRPPLGHDEFGEFHTSIHGLTAADVVDAPDWHEVLPQLLDFVGDDLLVAHNADFDVTVLRAVAAEMAVVLPPVEHLCTLLLARASLELPSYRLNHLVEHFGGSLENHHDALADSRAVLEVVAGMLAATGAPDLRALATTHGIAVGRIDQPGPGRA